MATRVPSREVRKDYIQLTYNNLRNISTPEDIENDRKVYAGNILADQILTLPTDDNVREYLVEAEGKKRRAKTQVHRAIEDTLDRRPQDFAVLNGGLVIVARDCDVDDANKKISLLKPSLINGAQTQGVLKEFYETKRKKQTNPDPIHIKFELIVTNDDELIGEISIARNFQNDVMTVTIVGRRGMFDELEKRFQNYELTPDGLSLRKSETELADDFVKTERLIQVLTALTPAELWMRALDDGQPNKAYTYSAASKCLKQYQDVYTWAKSEIESDEVKVSPEQQEKAIHLYEFYLDVVGQAWELYNKWKTHQGFKGTGIRAIERDEKGNVISVPDGIVFPVLAALSGYAKKTRKGWRIELPPSFSDEKLIEAVKQVYINVAKSNPNTMGKSAACYFLLGMLAKSAVS